MKLKRLITSIILILIFSGCQRIGAELQEQNQIELGAVGDAVLSRALTISPLEQGYRFRLYILPDGETDLRKMVATRTYTINDKIGTPVLDEGQKPIKVAQDDYDFYLVGPLMGVDEKGATLEIASEVGVNVYVGNDIISSLTNVTVQTGSNSVQPEPLSHRMAKMQVVIERPDGASYTNLRVDEILLFQQPLTGNFAFGDDGGSITPDQETFTRKYAPPTKESEDRYVAIDYIFAHNKKDVKIETTFDARVFVNGVQLDNTYYGQSGSVSTDVVVGNSYQITANPLVPTELLWRLTLVPWHNKEQGSTSSDDRELICSFSGLDAPMEVGGKLYWRDRSGNDNHGELFGSVVYNAEQRYYTATQDLGSFIQLSALGEMKDITVELVMASAYNGLTTPLFASAKDGSPQANVHLPYVDESLYLDWGDANADRIGPFPYMVNDLGVYQGMATWQFTRKVNATNVYSAIYRNGTLVTGEDKRSRALDFDKVKFLSGGNAVTKLYGVRIYRRVLTPAEMYNSAKNDKAVYAKISTDDAGKYVQKGLILDLQGATAPSNALVTSRTVWQDQSSYQNHAVMLNGGPTYDAGSKGYKFAGGNNKIMQLLRGLGDLSDCTIEIVMTAGSNKLCNNINFLDRTGSNVYTFGSPNGKYFATFPNATFTIADATSYGTNVAHSWSTVRNLGARNIFLYQNGYAQHISDASKQQSVAIPNSALGLEPITIVQIGGKLGGNLAFNGIIHAIRVYNRSLNDTERHMNFELDKTKYNTSTNRRFLPPVKSDMIFCYDGRSGLMGHSGNGNGATWVDQVVEGINMSCVVPAGVSGSITFNPLQRAIVSSSPVYSNKGVYMINNLKPELSLTELTIETVSQTKTPRYNYFMDVLDNTGARIMMVRPNTANDNGTAVELFATNFFDAWNIIQDMPGPISKRSLVYVLNINTKTVKIYCNGVLRDSRVSKDVAKMNAFKMAKIVLLNTGDGFNQAFDGNIHAFRLYGRELTAAEIKENFNSDKVIFGL